MIISLLTTYEFKERHISKRDTITVTKSSLILAPFPKDKVSAMHLVMVMNKYSLTYWLLSFSYYKRRSIAL